MLSAMLGPRRDSARNTCSFCGCQMGLPHAMVRDYHKLCDNIVESLLCEYVISGLP
jgi:hypothetical protein